MSDTIQLHTSRTVTHTATLPSGEVVELPAAPCEHIDPVLTDDGNTLRFAVEDDYGREYEWQEGVEFVQASYRHNYYCDDPQAWIESVRADHDVFVVDVFEHGNIMYSLSGEGPQCQFDTASGGAAIAIPNEHHDNPFTNTRDAAEGILAEYTAWCNGDVYGVYEMGKVNGEWAENDYPCFGIIGWEYAEQCLKEGI